MTKKILVVMLIIMTSGFSVKAQNTVKDPESIIKEFFQLYKNKSTDSALEYIFSTNPWMSGSKDQTDALGLKLKNLISVIGDFHGEKLITKASIASDIVMYSYLIKYDRQPLRFIMTFYKPNDSWRLYNFKFDDSLDDELDEAIKAHRLPENTSGK
ncbi:MAG: hypothetical protein COW03_01000 [Cytophagales bacterium CG12_big_fil_rev_8_21_14_0_65_40_12]|nr:MAG: hypothetical protein COW03_01000 [Cytophagales bacterium CG12_big_fil_rev_8_21_14_0_65_40_12]